ncbi:MAG TPA: histone deacetylase family protein [Rhizomicrobium sp.]|nr:histone deacetylase family protein [Rhizomicrobium sp.]
MKTFYSAAHLEHAPANEFEGGRLTPMPEVPARAEAVRARIEERALGPVVAPTHFGLEPILRVHSREFADFLVSAHADWTKKYGPEVAEAVPSAWPARGLRPNRAGDIEARLGSYAFDTATPIVRGTWEAARSAVDVALSAAQCIRDGARAAFALTRPPGHHAASELFGGYCYLNNVAIAAQWFADSGARCAILDVDYHHGNGTQAIFYSRADVFYCSLHADPAFAFPHFSGFADERGEGGGQGANLNLPLPSRTEFQAYEQALTCAREAIMGSGADILLVSLGLDTFENDPISDFRLKSGDYLKMGDAIARLNKRTLFVFEGGYDLATLGLNTVNVLEGFEQG